jgi:protein phosphatase 2C family protein 2/3
MELYFESGCDFAQGRRDTMEDTHILLDDVSKVVPDFTERAAFYGVFDGHGGVDAANMVQQHLHEQILKSDHFKKGDITKAVSDGFERTDDLIVKQSNEKGWMNGSTAVVSIIYRNNLYVANIGDSEAVLVKKNAEGQWEAEALTVPHKASDPTEKERIEKLGGHVFFGRVFGALAVSRSFGDSKFKTPKTSQNFVSWEPALKTVTLTPEHKFLILACDGLWDVMNHQEVAQYVIKAKYEQGKSASEISKMLVHEALNKRTEDNVTVIVIFFDWREKKEGETANASTASATTVAAPSSTSSTSSASADATASTSSPSTTTTNAVAPHDNTDKSNNTNTTPSKLSESSPSSSPGPAPTSEQSTKGNEVTNVTTVEMTDAKTATIPNDDSINQRSTQDAQKSVPMDVETETNPQSHSQPPPQHSQ